MNYAYYETIAGLVEIGCDDAVTSLRKVESPAHPHCPTALSDQAAAQLTEYFAGSRTAFDLPIRPMGTDFQMAVWEALRAIPRGETRSYGQIAASIGKPGAARAIGMACNHNPIWILIPCHRVVGSNKKLTGYAGGLAMKQMLLDLEK